MKTLFVTLLTAMMLSFTLQSCDDDDTIGPLESTEYAEFNTAMRELWTDHAWWTRNVIMGIIDDTPGTTEALNRLLENQDDIGNAIKPYYGDAAGAALTVLLREHITIAGDLLVAANAGNTNAFNTANAAWYANADEIAAFLNAANPENWPLQHMENMMKSHLDLTLAEATARLNGDYAADVAAYDAVYTQMMEMADMLSEGIALQFPDKF